MYRERVYSTVFKPSQAVTKRISADDACSPILSKGDHVVRAA